MKRNDLISKLQELPEDMDVLLDVPPSQHQVDDSHEWVVDFQIEKVDRGLGGERKEAALIRE